LIGYNTDGEGFMTPLAAAGFSAAGKRAVVLGAGGSARSIVYRLARDGADITIVNRTPERSGRLAEEIAALIPRSKVSAFGFDLKELRDIVESADLVVNTTSVGMHPNEEAIPPIPVDALNRRQIVYDLIYNPLETRLLAAAKKVGAKTLNGVAMLVNQGAASFKIWTGVVP